MNRTTITISDEIYNRFNKFIIDQGRNSTGEKYRMNFVLDDIVKDYLDKNEGKRQPLKEFD